MSCRIPAKIDINCLRSSELGARAALADLTFWIQIWIAEMPQKDYIQLTNSAFSLLSAKMPFDGTQRYILVQKTICDLKCHCFL